MEFQQETFGETVELNDSSHTRPFNNDWQILGELKLPAGAGTDAAIQTWLMEILDTLHLHVDFLNKILRSTQDAVARILQADALLKLEHTHLIIFAPQNRTAKGQSWGFFCIEKMDELVQNRETADHSIELYLYLEG
jgi:hypothetical protein